MANQIFTIHPYLLNGGKTFVFDEPLVGLKAEAFVMGMSEMMHRACEKWGINKDNLCCNFSADFIPGDTVIHLEWLSEHDGYVSDPKNKNHHGNWYAWNAEKMIGWFCPALFLFFKTSPKNMYIRFSER